MSEFKTPELMKGSQYIQKSIKPPSNVRHFDNGRLFSAFKKGVAGALFPF